MRVTRPSFEAVLACAEYQAQGQWLDRAHEADVVVATLSMASRPMLTYWCTPIIPPKMTWSSTTTWPAIPTWFAIWTPFPMTQL